MVYYDSDFRHKLKEMVIYILKSNPDYYFTVRQIKKIIGRIDGHKVRDIIHNLEDEGYVKTEKILQEGHSSESIFVKWDGYL